MESRSSSRAVGTNRYRQFTPANNNGPAIAVTGGAMTIAGLILKSIAIQAVSAIGSALSLFCCFVCLLGCAEASGERPNANRNAEPRRQMMV
ncbi:MAG: hypothetical protein ACYCQI_06210 [Gammaproteobacteria bacterium]